MIDIFQSVSIQLYSMYMQCTLYKEYISYYIKLHQTFSNYLGGFPKNGPPVILLIFMGILHKPSSYVGTPIGTQGSAAVLAAAAAVPHPAAAAGAA